MKVKSHYQPEPLPSVFPKKCSKHSFPGKWTCEDRGNYSTWCCTIHNLVMLLEQHWLCFFFPDHCLLSPFHFQWRLSTKAPKIVGYHHYKLIEPGIHVLKNVPAAKAPTRLI